jgi:hypothetical protein
MTYLYAAPFPERSYMTFDEFMDTQKQATILPELVVDLKKRGDTYHKRALILARRAHGRKCAFRMLNANYTILKERHFSMTRHLQSVMLTKAQFADQIAELKKELEICKEQPKDSMSVCPTCKKRANLTKDIYPPIYVCPNNHSWRYSLEIRR